MENIILRCENLDKKIRKKQILKNVSVELYEGDILGFIGPNGSGKTTTIKLILGLQGITSGKVEINGYDVEKNFEKAIKQVGAIVENPDLYMYLTGFQNLKLISNLYKNVDNNRINEVVKLVGLENRINDKVSKYSLGMRQRLGIAQAILHKPNLLILDEPTNGLDPEGIKEVRELLLKLAKEEKMAIFISSHNLAELDNFCNKICIIKNGQIIETNTISELKKETQIPEYIIEVDNTKKIKTLIQNAELIDKNYFKIAIQKENIPFIVKQLVNNDISIYSICEESLTLEDAFIKKTGGNVIE